MKAPLKPSVAVLTTLVFAITLDAETLSVACQARSHASDRSQ